MKKLLRLLTLCLLMQVGALCQAQILIGQTAGFTGAVAAGVKETFEGAKLYIDSVNAKGGISGERIQLVSLDDKFEPKLAADNAKQLLENKSTLALFLTRGTPHTEAILPLLEQHKAPLVAPSTGATLLHKPVNRWVFNVRSSYQSEAKRLVTHLEGIGASRLGVIYRDDSFGEDVMTGLKSGFERAKMTPLSIQKYDRSKPDMAGLINDISANQLQHLVIGGAGTEVVQIVKLMREAGLTTKIYTLSNNAASGFIKAMGSMATGTVVSQVFPYERSERQVITRELMDLAKANNMSELSPAMMEGYAAAKVLVEGLRRASPKPTREKLRTALEGMRNYDIGGLTVSYSPYDHTGIEFVDISIITQDGKFRR